MSNNNTFVGSKIKGIRESKNLSIEEVAESSGLSTEQIMSIENGQNMPSLGPLIKIARALGIRLGTIMDDNEALGPVVCRAEEREQQSSISFSNGSADARSTWSTIRWHSRRPGVTWSRLSSTSTPRNRPTSNSLPMKARSSSM